MVKINLKGVLFLIFCGVVWSLLVATIEYIFERNATEEKNKELFRNRTEFCESLCASDRDKCFKFLFRLEPK